MTLVLMDVTVMEGSIKERCGRNVLRPAVPACHLDADEGSGGASRLRLLWDLPG